MNPRVPSRSAACGETEARERLNDARAQLQLAELTDRAARAEEIKAAASCAVLAGIAASDAACCKALGQTNRSQNHQDALALLRQVSPGGPDAAKKLGRLLALKDQAQYGFGGISSQKLASAQRQARGLVEFAELTMLR